MEEKKSVGLLEDKAFWLALACVVVILSSIWLFDYEGIVGNVVQSVSYLKEDSELRIGVNDVEGLYVANFKFLGAVSDSTIKIEEDSSIPFDGIVYSKFKMSFSNGEKLEKVTFTLKLKEDKLKKLGLSKEDVKVYVENDELGLFTTTDPSLESSQNYLYYNVVSSKKGNFVIGKKTKVAQAAEVKPVVEKKVEVKKPVVKKPTPKPAPVEKGFFSKIIDFFKNLF